MHYDNIGLGVPEILLPREGIDLSKWAVVACDQYTSQPEYWVKVRELVGSCHSTFHLILPEAYLEQGDQDQVARDISNRMNDYLLKNILVAQNPGFILVDRKTSHAPSRKGLIVSLDLDHYDFHSNSTSLIRASEGTVVDRLPPRIRIRENAPIEVPHVMVLIDDPEKTVIEPLFYRGLELIYDFELMTDSGHIKGYRIDAEDMINEIAAGLAALADPEKFEKKYGVTGKDVLLYAMGDGNHSLATAKIIWENLKKNAHDKEAIMRHPARYSLVELVNVHDAGLEFEPIHRVIFNVSADDLLKEMSAFTQHQGSTFSYSIYDSPEALEEFPAKSPGTHHISFVSQKICGTLSVKNPSLNLEVGTLQAILDEYTRSRPQVKIDYIHGDDLVTDLGTQPDNMGFFLPTISKHDLFKTIVLDGALPRKTFSMGNADEKRFYLECKKITF